MTQVILVFVVVLIGALVCAASVIQKSTKFVKKHTSSKEYEELAEMYDEAMEENPTDNMFISLYDDIEEHNKKVSENTEYRVTRLPKTNEVCFDTSKYGFQINSFGFVKITHKTKRKVKTSQFPLYLKATKANILTGFVPFPDTGIQLGSGTDVATVLFGNEKESIKKYKQELSKQYDRMKSIIAELNMYRNQVEEYKTDNNRIKKENVDLQNKYHELKIRFNRVGA